jgi:hypothetical protein
MHGRDTEKIEIPCREQQRDGIVVAGIAVDQDFPLCH